MNLGCQDGGERDPGSGGQQPQDQLRGHGRRLQQADRRGEARQGEARGAEVGDHRQDPGAGEHAAVPGAGHHGQAGPPGHLPGQDSPGRYCSFVRRLRKVL